MKKSLSVFTLVGGLFTAIGGFFFIIGCLMSFNFQYLAAHGEGDIIILPICFGGLGFLFLVIGVFLLYTQAAEARQKRRLVEQGDFVWADISGFPLDYSVTINRRPMFRVLACYQDPMTGQTYEFASDPIRYDPSPYVVAQKVRVFIDRRSNYKTYTMDIASVWPGYLG